MTATTYTDFIIVVAYVGAGITAWLKSNRWRWEQ